MAGYDAVLFDNDGVLMTPIGHEALREAARSAFHAVGVDDPTPAHVDALDRLSVPFGIVSTNQQRTVEFGIRQFGLADAFETAHARAPTVEPTYERTGLGAVASLVAE
jgi:phosphoglycolate phosphatase-like HAD superfamily hydrolase